MMRRFMLPSEGRIIPGFGIRGSGIRLLVILPVHPPPEQPAAERAEPAEHVKHVAEVHHLDEITVEIPDEEKRMAAGRPFGPADTLDPFGDQVVVPALQVADIEGNVRQANAVPGYRDWRLLRLEFED